MIYMLAVTKGPFLSWIAAKGWAVGMLFLWSFRAVLKFLIAFAGWSEWKKFWKPGSRV